MPGPTEHSGTVVLSRGWTPRRATVTQALVVGAFIASSEILLYELSDRLPDVLRGSLALLAMLLLAALLYLMVSSGAVITGEAGRVSRKLVEMEDRYRALFERSRDCIYLASFTGKFLDANQPALDLLGYRREDIEKVTFATLLPPSELPKVAKAMAEAAGTGAAGGEFRLRRKDGSEVTVEIASSVVYANGRPHCIQGIARDITERKRAEEQLRESELRYRLMIEQSISGFYIADEGLFRYVNPHMARVLGFDSPDEITGMPVLERVADRDRARIAHDIQHRLASVGSSARRTFFALRRDGTEIEIETQAARVLLGGRPVLMGLLHDVSEARKAQRKIEQYVVQLEQAVRSTVKTVATMGELRDPYTHGHERRVGEIAAAIAMELSLPPERVEGVRIAGYLHDVGKIAVPAEILAKPTRLTPAEFQIVKDHARHGHNILKGVPFSWPIATTALQHHERWDGSGYPDGAKGEEILLEARILGVADTVEAMASHRPYRPGLGVERALDEIEKNRGRLYDPSVVDACLRLFRKKAFAMPS